MKKETADITKELANFVVMSKYEDFPMEVREIAKNCMIDGVGVILAGSTEPCALIVRQHAIGMMGKKESTILGKGKTGTATNLAAFVNATAGHAMDWDDTAVSDMPDRSVLLHPTMLPLAAGLAVGETLKASGRDLLTAFLAGFEVECKIAAAIDIEHWSRGFHTTGTCGVFGAAATAAKLMGLNFNQTLNALGLAASMAAGLGVQVGTMAKPLHVGRAAENGVVSAQLAANGFDASPETLEGRRGFFQAYGGGFDPDKIISRLGRPFSIQVPGVFVKPYPSGVVGHPGMDTMKSLVVKHHIQPEMVKRVSVKTGSNIIPPKGPLRYTKAQTALEAKFCVPFQMASMIIRRKAGIEEFTDEFVKSPAVQEMMNRIEVTVDPELDSYGRNQYMNRIELEQMDGQIVREMSSGHYRGGPNNPLGPEGLKEKFNDCVHRILNPAQADHLLKTMESIETLEFVGKLIEKASVA